MTSPLISLEAQDSKRLVRRKLSQIVEAALSLVRIEHRDVPGLGFQKLRLRTTKSRTVGLRVAQLPTMVVLDTGLDQRITQSSLTEPALTRDRRQTHVHQPRHAS